MSAALIIDNSNHWLNALKQELGVRNPDQARRVFQAVLPALMAVTLPEYRCYLFRELPHELRSWVDRDAIEKTGLRPGESNAEDFFDRTADRLDRDEDPCPLPATRAVFRVLHKYITDGWINDPVGWLPPDLASLWVTSLPGDSGLPM